MLATILHFIILSRAQFANQSHIGMYTFVKIYFWFFSPFHNNLWRSLRQKKELQCSHSAPQKRRETVEVFYWALLFYSGLLLEYFIGAFGIFKAFIWSLLPIPPPPSSRPGETVWLHIQDSPPPIQHSPHYTANVNIQLSLSILPPHWHKLNW